jgi:hypothetical protein
MKTSKRAPREYRFYTQAGEVDLEQFLAAIAARGEATVEAEAPGYKLTRKGRRALKGAA